jgi:hypothetical protein
MMNAIALRERLENLRPWGLGLIVIGLILAGLAWYWSIEPEPFDPRQRALEYAAGDESALVPGVVTTTALIEVTRTLLDKPGGYLLNDMFPPRSPWLMDNMPNWESGVLKSVRDMVQVLRNDFSRSSVQSDRDTDLERAEPLLNIPEHYWLFPAAEDEYRKGIAHLENYRARLADTEAPDAQFFTRADNLNVWLSLVSTRLGALAQELSKSVGERVMDTTLAGDASAQQSTTTPDQKDERTAWRLLDDRFYETRGTCWALLIFLRAVEVDFAPVLAQRNSLAALRQVIRELEGTQQPMRSLFVLNGSGFGYFANHSLVMASYVSRASSSLQGLRKQLERG